MKAVDRRPLAGILAEAAASYQAAQVIPHCTACTKPCCKLEALVLDLSWKQVKAMWQREESRASFDQTLAAGHGPVEIRAANGRYYIHSRPCPAYDASCGQCRIYGDPLKPAGCSDFPVYEDGGMLTADLRCEAVDLDQLKQHLQAALGPEYRLKHSADRDFPFLITLLARREKR